MYSALVSVLVHRICSGSGTSSSIISWALFWNRAQILTKPMVKINKNKFVKIHIMQWQIRFWYPKMEFRVICEIIPTKCIFWRQVEHRFSSFFCQIFAMFVDFSKFHSPFDVRAPLWKIIKYGKNLSKEEENSCSRPSTYYWWHLKCCTSKTHNITQVSGTWSVSSIKI